MFTPLARLVVGIAARMAAPSRRERFRREWDAEIWHEIKASGGLSALKHSLGAVPDAYASRRLAPRSPQNSSGGIGLWVSDVLLAFRGYRRNPGFTSVTVFTLALGIGGSAAIFTILDRVVLDPLPYPESSRLVDLANQVPGIGPDAVWGMSTAQQVFLTERSRTLDAVGLYRGLGANIETPDGPQRASGWRVTASLMSVLGARAHLGRVITAADDMPGGPPVVVLSHGFWTRQFGADRDVIGKVVRIGAQPYEVIGVLAPGFKTPGTGSGGSTDIWMPLRIDVEGRFSNNHVYQMVGRLAEGVDIAAAEAEIEGLTPQLTEDFPTAYTTAFLDGSGFRTQLVPLKESVVGDMARNLWVVFGAVGLVLLIACGNVANLFLVRMEGRRVELAVRSALGAGRGALARLLVSEGLVLSVVGGVLGLSLARVGLPALMKLSPGAIPRVDSVTLGWGTVAFVACLSGFIGLALGLYPLLRLGQGNHSTLASGGSRTNTQGRAGQRTRSMLIVGQVALALTLVIGASLLVQSLSRYRSIDPGMEIDGVLTTRLYLTRADYPGENEIWAAYRDILANVRRIPGVVAVGMSEELPVEGGFGCTVQGFENPAVYEQLELAGQTTCAGQERTTAGYFAATGIPVLTGREFTDADSDNPTRGAVVVSKAFADRFWPGEDPIGQGVAPSGRREGPFYHVVGVVGDTPARSLDGDPAFAVHYPIKAHPEGRESIQGWWRPTSMNLVVKVASGDALAIFPQVRAAIAGVDQSIPLTRVASMETIVADSAARITFTSVLLATAAGIALLLAAVGIYGVVSYVISRSTREIGMRMAVGARPGQIMQHYMKRSVTLVVLGTVIGTGIALVLTRVMEGILYEVEATDPLSFIAAAGLLGGVALLATLIPAGKAARIEPVEALRVE